MSGSSLLLCHRLPFPPNKGDKIRSFALLKHLAEQGPVHVACFVDDSDDLKYCDDVRRIAGGKCFFVPLARSTKWWRAGKALLGGQSVTTAYFASPAMTQWIKDILASERIENSIIFGSAMAPHLLGDRLHARSALFDMVDVDSDKWRQYAQSSAGLLRWIYAREARAVAALERKAAQTFGRTLLVSPFEAQSFRALAPESADKIDAITNGVDLAYFSPGDFPGVFPQDEVPIVMTGRMDYRPNVDGALWFVREVAPHVFARLPKTRVYLVGSNPSPALRKLGNDRVTVTGAVDDVRPYLRGAATVIAPLLIARGIQNKVLEAMAMEKAVVATPAATRALKVEAGAQLWIANNASCFADAVIDSVQNPQRHRIAHNARRYVEQHHDWKTILADLDRVLESLSQERVAQGKGRTGGFEATALAFAPDISGAKA